MGDLGTTLRNAIAPVARSLVADAGRSTVQIRRAVATGRAADGSEVRNWSTVSGAAALEVSIVDVEADVASRVWGSNVVVHAHCFVTDEVVVLPNDGLVVTAGDKVGTHFAVSAARPMPMGGLQKLALRTTQDRFA